ncbi:MAG: hypothetical protein BGN97_15485 [Microbacterium sp. 69-10]|nr:MAG: hypothetical protein BGN97_15485 [Microbacterium sp. 69-10]
MLDEFVKHGTTAIRSHVDVDLGLGQRGIEAVREAVAPYEGGIACEIVAFPQDGVQRRPGVLELLADAAKAGAEHIGGLDPAGIDKDPVGQIDAIFALAAEHGVGIDIHLHDGGSLGAFQFDLIVDRTQKLGLQGRVNIAHGFAIVDADDARRHDLLQQMGELDISMTTVAPLRMKQFSLHEFAEAGGAPFAGVQKNDLTAGSRADVVLVDSENTMDVLVRTLPRELTVGGEKLLYQR